jgi:lipopolysaccharide/colanic/teichoic acid biosynthesis glycosyltransferase
VTFLLAARARTRRADHGRRRDAVALPAGHLDPHQARQRGSRVPLAEMDKLDYLYVAGWSLWTDIRILLRTIP